MDTLLAILYSQHKLTGLFYLVTGAVLGAFLGVTWAHTSRQPRLLIQRGASGKHRDHGQTFFLQVRNQPTFLLKGFEGDTARDLVVWLQAKSPGSKTRNLHWHNHDSSKGGFSLPPGETGQVLLFSIPNGENGYFLVDNKMNPIAKFTDREMKFSVWINDKYSRSTKASFTVIFDDSDLVGSQQLEIRFPTKFSERLTEARIGLVGIVHAFVRK